MISKTSYLLFCSCANPVCVQTDSVDLMQKMSSVDQFLALSSQQMWCQAMQPTGYSARSQDDRDTNRWDIEIQIYVSQRVPRHKLCVQKPCALRAILDRTTTKVKHDCAGKWFYKCNGQIHKYGIPGVSSKECKSPFAGTLFPPTCSLLWSPGGSRVPYYWINRRALILGNHIFERFDAILFVKVCADSVPSVGIVALVNTRDFLDELPPNKHWCMCVIMLG